MKGKMKKRYWLFKRGITYYLEDSENGKQTSLRTTDKREAEQLRDAKLDASRQPSLNLALAKAYFTAHDFKLVERTWAEVMENMALGTKDSTRERIDYAMKSQAFDRIRNIKLIETTTDDLFAVLNSGTVATIKYLRQLHNLALGYGWLPIPILAPKLWPKMKSKPKRAIHWEEHSRLIEAEKIKEWRLFLRLLWETGASQSDAASLSHENIDWKTRLLTYHRKKLQPNSQPARFRIGQKLEKVLRQLPAKGPFFLSVGEKSSSLRSSKFRHLCRKVGIHGATLHSYRYAWAERAKINGYPERWAQVALGHKSQAVHNAYAKGAEVFCPSLEEYEKRDI